MVKQMIDQARSTNINHSTVLVSLFLCVYVYVYVYLAESAKNLIDRVASASEAELYHWSSIAVAACKSAGHVHSLSIPFF
jgi:hypothetical protein